MKYSIIIPVYNAEQTIDRCVLSLTNQKYSDCEIILVNDGSKDQSRQKCMSYAQQFANVHYIEKENGGASSARNAGIAAARGEYILFVDSDDYVAPNYFSMLDMYENCDLLVFALAKVRSNNIQPHVQPESLLCASDLFEQLRLLILTRTINEPVTKRFKRSIIIENHLTFNENMIVAEDFNFCLAYAVHCNSVKIVNDTLYYYDVSNDDSLCRKYKENLICQFPLVFETAQNTVLTVNCSSVQKKSLLQIVDWLYCQSFITCVMEEFKRPVVSVGQILKKIRFMCRYFNKHNQHHFGYVHILHFVLRNCIRFQLSFVIYIAVKIYKKRQVC